MHVYHHADERNNSTTAFKIIIILGFLGLGVFLLVGDLIVGGNPVESAQFQSTEMDHQIRMREIRQNGQIIMDNQYKIWTVLACDERTGMKKTFIGTNSEIRKAKLFDHHFTILEINNNVDANVAQDNAKREIELANRELADAIEQRSRAEHELTEVANGLHEELCRVDDTGRCARQADLNSAIIVERGAKAKLESCNKNMKKMLKEQLNSITAPPSSS